MNSSNSTDYQKFAASPTPQPAPSMTATGIPVNSSTGQYYSSDHSQMPAYQAQPKTQVPWSSGLFDCTSDVKNCCITCWCPCITFGQIAEIVDKGSSSCALSGALYTLITVVIGCPCFYSCFYRSKMREQYMLKDNPCGDCLVHCCCESCALCQEYRELQSQGYDMSIGWHGNVEKRNHEVGMTPIAPVVEGGMTR